MSVASWGNTPSPLRSRHRCQHVSAWLRHGSKPLSRPDAPNRRTFHRLYTAEGILLLVLRWTHYRWTRQHYYLLDWCYVANALLVLNVWHLPTNVLLFKINFAHAMGPLLWSILAFRNSIVFHSTDKMSRQGGGGGHWASRDALPACAGLWHKEAGARLMRDALMPSSLPPLPPCVQPFHALFPRLRVLVGPLAPRRPAGRGAGRRRRRTRTLGVCRRARPDASSHAALRAVGSTVLPKSKRRSPCSRMPAAAAPAHGFSSVLPAPRPQLVPP